MSEVTHEVAQDTQMEKDGNSKNMSEVTNEVAQDNQMENDSKSKNMSEVTHEVAQENQLEKDSNSKNMSEVTHEVAQDSQMEKDSKSKNMSEVTHEVAQDSQIEKDSKSKNNKDMPEHEVVQPTQPKREREKAGVDQNKMKKIKVANKTHPKICSKTPGTCEIGNKVAQRSRISTPEKHTSQKGRENKLSMTPRIEVAQEHINDKLIRSARPGRDNVEEISHSDTHFDQKHKSAKNAQ